MKYIEGDLIQLAMNGEFDAITHGCNCFCQMGKGIALTIKRKFPEAYIADCETQKGNKNKLGTCTIAKSQNSKGDELRIINAYTQFDWRGRGLKANYDAIRSCMQWINTNFPNTRLGLPKIGAGLANGDWNVIERILEEELTDLEPTVVIYRA